MPSANSPTNTIAVGDCIETMRSWPEASVDLIFADPPYNIGFKYDEYEDTRHDEDYIQWTRDWIAACAHLLKPTGSFYILIGDEYAAETRLYLKQLEREGKLVFRNWIIWHYTFGQNCKLKFNRSHAHLFYCVGKAALRNWRIDNPPFTFNRLDIAVPSARQTTYGDARANPTGKLPDDTWYLRHRDVLRDLMESGMGAAAWHLRPQQTGGEYFKIDEDVWYQSRLCGTFKERLGWHPCQLPEALLERIIKLSSNPGDIVFDPFTGSGTTLAVAARLERRWLGTEMSKDYAAKATERVLHAQTTGQTVLTTLAEKGIELGKPKKKAEPHRSPHLGKGRKRTQRQT